MKNKNGFTVLEIVVVILLIGVLMLVLVPRLTKTFNETKKKTFATGAESLYSIARDTYAEDAASGKVPVSGTVIYCDDKTESTYSTNCNKLNTKGEDLEYYIVFYNRKMMEYTVANKNYCYSKIGNFDYYTYDYVSVDMGVDASSITGGKMDCTDAPRGLTCDCTGGLLLADGYYFWNSYEDLRPGQFPSEYSTTFEGLGITTAPAAYIKTLLNDGNVTKHEACLYVNGNHFCLDSDYYEGDIDAAKNKLQNDMRSTFNDNSITCTVDNGDYSRKASCSDSSNTFSCAVVDYTDAGDIGAYCTSYSDKGLCGGNYFYEVYNDGYAQSYFESGIC